ncbi:multidrug efflux SMR transporter [Aeromonas veronii]
MNFFLLITAVTLNIMANYFMKKTHMESDSPIFSLTCALTFLAFSFVCYTLALKTIPISTAYVLLTGCSLIGITTIGIFVFGEPVNVNVVLGMLFILAGVVVISVGASNAS